MTTLVYSHKHKQVAIDSRISANGVITSDNYNKTLKNEFGLWIFTGKICDIESLSKMKHGDHCDVLPDVSALLINDESLYLVLVNNNGYCEWSRTDFDCAFGSGADFALAALDFGSAPKESVEYAMTRDMYTGGKVRVFDL